jgi:hypothetical protein
VKVHTSHLEEVDRYILDLQTKLEESEKKRKSAEVAASIRELKRVASFDLAAVQRNRDGRPAPNMVRHDGHLISHLSLENGMNGLRIHTRSSLGDNSGLSSFSSIREIQRDTYWEVENSSGYVLLSAYTVFYLLGFCGILSTKQELYLQGALITE